jgi:hypothetical protein
LRQALQPACGLRPGLGRGGQIGQRVNLGEVAAGLREIGNYARQADTGNLQPPAALRDLADTLAHESRSINSPFPANDQVGRAETLFEARQAGKQRKPGFELCAQKSQQTKTQPARGARPGLRREITPKLLPNDSRQAAQAALGQGKVARAQAFLRPIDASCPFGAKEGVPNIHRHEDLIKPARTPRSLDSG